MTSLLHISCDLIKVLGQVVNINPRGESEMWNNLWATFLFPFFASVFFSFFAMLKVISSTFTRLLNELIGGSGSKNDGISWY